MASIALVNTLRDNIMGIELEDKEECKNSSNGKTKIVMLQNNDEKIKKRV